MRDFQIYAGLTYCCNKRSVGVKRLSWGSRCITLHKCETLEPEPCAGFGSHGGYLPRRLRVDDLIVFGMILPRVFLDAARVVMSPFALSIRQTTMRWSRALILKNPWHVTARCLCRPIFRDLTERLWQMSQIIKQCLHSIRVPWPRQRLGYILRLL